MKSAISLVFSLLLCLTASAQLGKPEPQNSSKNGGTCDVIRDIKTPLSHVFDPATAPSIWMMPTDQEAEMPLPGGINEDLRREIDAARSARLNSNPI
ncbi:MAG: hypothetical protein EBQ97_07440, partial [Bacteroidetes bacterium]|nr:hypothetical protein [Bacteroidota bacterium]